MSDGGAYCFFEKIWIRQVLPCSNPDKMSKNLKKILNYEQIYCYLLSLKLS